MRRDDRFDDIDKAMSRKVQAIFSDPARHQFISEHDQIKDDPWYLGPRGGKPRGLKRKCFYCGQVQAGHADVTEAL